MSGEEAAPPVAEVDPSSAETAPAAESAATPAAEKAEAAPPAAETAEAAPAKDAEPAKEAAPANEAAPVNDAAPVKEAAPAKAADGEKAGDGARTPGAGSASSKISQEGIDKVVNRSSGAFLRQLSKSRSRTHSLEAIRRKSQTIDSFTMHDDAEEKLLEEERKWKMPADFYYETDDPTLIPALNENEIPKSVSKPCRFLGFDFGRHYNLVWTSEKEFAYITGHSIVIVDLSTDQRRFLHGRDTGGIGCVSMSAGMQFMAVAEKSTTTTSPNVYIYEYEGMRLYRILRKGTEKGYSSVKFSPHNKSHIACLGMFPDYLLAVWDWRNERKLLTCKAYGQDVFDVVWGNWPGQITTCGTGHIRFWKMATTFTGLKLQGDIGKFGGTELSDIVGFLELPDGKVVTGSEYGKLLLWEGVFVKVEILKTLEDAPGIATPGRAVLAHTGAIDVVLYDAPENAVVSGGEDGFLRWWGIEELDDAEPDFDAGILEYGITLKKEVRIPAIDAGEQYRPAHIKHIARSADDKTWLIQDDANGVVWRYNRRDNSCTTVMSSNAKAVTSVAVMAAHPGLVITSGMDGSLRAFNMTAERDNELFVDRRQGNAGIVCMAIAPESVDIERRTVSCGYEDGVVRTFFVCKDGFALVQACKPHSCPVTQIAYNADGTLVAVLGANNAIFFLEVRDRENQAQPLGFIQVPTQVNSIMWNDRDTGHILLALDDGSICEICRPVPEMIDNTETYSIFLDYRAVMPELPEPDSEDESGSEDEDEAVEGDPADPDQPPKLTREEKKEKKRKDKETAETTKKALAGDDEEEEEHHDEAIQSSVRRAVYLSDEAVLFTGTGRYQGYLWEIPMQPAPIIEHIHTALGEHEPTPSMCTMHTKLPPNAEVTHLSISASDRFLFVGFADGHVWVISLANMQFYADIGVSDATTGMIPAIGADAEESLLCVGGADGSLTAIELNPEGLLECAKMKEDNAEVAVPELTDVLEQTYNPMAAADPEEWDIPTVDAPGLVGIPKDIMDRDFYSIQDAKLKSEEENAKAAAERQKRRVRDRIQEVRAELEEVQARNNAIPYGPLTGEELTIDPDYVAHLSKEMEERVEEVKTELSWSIEFHERGMQKLKDFFLGRLDFERIEVLAFSSPHRVSTFRTPSMSSELQSNLARLHELIFAADRESDDEDGAGDSNVNRRTGDLGGDAKKGSPNESKMDDSPDRPSIDQQLSVAEVKELRRQQRILRKSQMSELEKSKPSEAYEDPLDVEAIAHAEATLGNYMLKTSDEYQVPENQRMNAEKKRRQMFLLEESMHAIKTEFNHRVLALRDFRQQVRAEVKRDLTALKDIDQQLGTLTVWAVGLLDDQPGAPPEFPERRFEHGENDMKIFARAMKVAAGQEVAPDPEEVEEVAEEYGSEDEEDGEEGEPDEEDEEEGEEDEDALAAKEEEKAQKKARKRASKESKGPIIATGAPVAGRAALMSRRIERLTLRAKILQASGDAATALGKAVANEAQARLWHDKMQLEEHVRQVIDTFDGAVASIEKEKAKLESDLKNADMKLLVLYEELLTLNELEEKDEELLRKATKCRQDKTSIMHQIKDCQDQLGEKKLEIEQWQNEETSLQAEFTELVGENSPFLGALLKIYKKKVKRSKRKKMGDDDEMEDDEDEDEDESEMDSDEDVDDEDEDVGPPQGCDVQIYESVLDLREKRLDMEDALQEIQRAVDELKKTHSKLLADERRIDKEQKQTDAEIQQFQTDKQRKLNQVAIVFALRLSQVQCLDGGTQGIGKSETPGMEKLPGELDKHVVFTHEGLNRLMTRITEVHQEIKDVKVNFQQLRKDYRLRKKEQKVGVLHIEDLNAKFQDIQMLKFGQVVDLDLIERSAPNKYVQELGEKVNDEEQKNRSKLSEWEKRIEKQKKDLAKVTCDNTSLMEQIVSMGYSQMQLDAALNARIANVTVNDTEPLIELREMERERLKDLLTLQGKEIATLQAEINLFRKKGGHIYTTVTANRMPDQ